MSDTIKNNVNKMTKLNKRIFALRLLAKDEM